jgi:hypothetical protein
MFEDSKKKDIWDRADVIGKLLIPIVVVAATLSFDASKKQSEARQKTLEVAIDILKSPKSSETEQLRSWALIVFQKETGTASANLTEGATQELQNGTPLPGPPRLQLPTSAQLRVAIIRLQGTPPDQSEKIRSALADGGYTNVTLTERAGVFPDKPEVRFYYLADSQNAQALNDYISGTLGIPITVSNKSQDPDASSHRPGDLHVYIR